MTATQRHAWDLTEQEFEAFRIPYHNKVGTHISLNGKYKIEFKTNKNKGSAGLAHTFEFTVNGKKHCAPFNYAQKLMFELPEDYPYFITYGFVEEYANENNLFKTKVIVKNKFNFHNGDLIRDLEKIKSYDSPKVKKDELKSDGEDIEDIYIMDVNDNAYFYVNKSDRDADVKTLKEYLA